MATKSKIIISIAIEAEFADEADAVWKALFDVAGYVKSSASFLPDGFKEVRNDARGFTLRSEGVVAACDLYERSPLPAHVGLKL